jgi:hypothetical protein
MSSRYQNLIEITAQKINQANSNWPVQTSIAWLNTLCDEEFIDSLQNLDEADELIKQNNQYFIQVADGRLNQGQIDFLVKALKVQIEHRVRHQKNQVINELKQKFKNNTDNQENVATQDTPAVINKIGLDDSSCDINPTVDSAINRTAERFTQADKALNSDIKSIVDDVISGVENEINKIEAQISAAQSELIEKKINELNHRYTTEAAQPNQDFWLKHSKPFPGADDLNLKAHYQNPGLVSIETDMQKNLDDTRVMLTLRRANFELLDKDNSDQIIKQRVIQKAFELNRDFDGMFIRPKTDDINILSNNNIEVKCQFSASYIKQNQGEYNQIAKNIFDDFTKEQAQQITKEKAQEVNDVEIKAQSKDKDKQEKTQPVESKDKLTKNKVSASKPKPDDTKIELNKVERKPLPKHTYNVKKSDLHFFNRASYAGHTGNMAKKEALDVLKQEIVKFQGDNFERFKEHMNTTHNAAYKTVSQSQGFTTWVLKGLGIDKKTSSEEALKAMFEEYKNTQKAQNKEIRR